MIKAFYITGISAAFIIAACVAAGMIFAVIENNAGLLLMAQVSAWAMYHMIKNMIREYKEARERNFQY